MNTEKGNEKRRKKGEFEKEVTKVLSDQKLSAIKSMLEKDHAIDCILLSILDKGKWKDAKDFMKQLKLTLPDGTFRARMLEIENNGIVKHKSIDAKKKRWATTRFGKYVGKLLLDFFDQIDDGGIA